MRYIRKGESPEAFELWKEQEQPTSWGALGGNPVSEEQREEGVHYYSKAELRTVLHQEQLGLCCFCTVAVFNKSTSPIDHLEPREGDTQTDRIFDFSNLGLSCPGGQNGKVKPRKLHCDAAKRNKSISVYPHQPGCETQIKFSIDGSVLTEGQPDPVVDTVKVLNLNLPKLVNARRSVIDAYIWSDAEQQTLISPDAAAELLEGFAEKVELLSDGQGRGYASAVKSVLKLLAGGQ